MRVSGDREDADFVGESNFGRYKVTVDGVQIKQPITADDVAGYVLTYERDEAGEIVIDQAAQLAKRTTLHGVVAIIDTRPD